MNPVLAAAKEALDFLASRGWSACLIGGLAVQRWGEPRSTRDADLTVVVELGEEEPMIRALLGRFRPRLENALEFALRSRVVLIQSDAGPPVDIALGGLPFEHRVVDRSTSYDFGGGATLRTCSAEDLVVYKAFAGRDQDWADIDRVLARQRGNLDLEAIRSELSPLLELKEDSGPAARLEERIARIYLGGTTS
jgi:hypothetical protein